MNIHDILFYSLKTRLKVYAMIASNNNACMVTRVDFPKSILTMFYRWKNASGSAFIKGKKVQKADPPKMAMGRLPSSLLSKNPSKWL